MIDTDNLVGNEEITTNKTRAAAAPESTYVNEQTDSGKAIQRSNNIFTRLFTHFTKKKQTVQLNMSTNVKTVKQPLESRQDQKMINAILDDDINIVYDKHVIKIKVLDSEMLPKEFVGFIGKHADLLLKLHLQIDYISYFGFLYDQTLVETIQEAEESCNARELHELIIIKIITNYFDYFLRLLFENDHLLQLLGQKQFLYNLLVFYNSKMDLKDFKNEDWTLAMQKFTPIMLTECYRIYDKFNIEACTIIDSLALTINFKQASLFSSINISDGCTMTSDKQIKKFIDKQSAMMYEKDYIKDLLNAGDSLYFNHNGNFRGVYKCCSQDDIIRTIDYLKAYSSICHKSKIELNVDKIRLNGYRQFIEDYQKLDDSVIQRICKKLLTAQD